MVILQVFTITIVFIQKHKFKKLKWFKHIKRETSYAARATAWWVWCNSVQLFVINVIFARLQKITRKIFFRGILLVDDVTVLSKWINWKEKIQFAQLFILYRFPSINWALLLLVTRCYFTQYDRRVRKNCFLRLQRFLVSKSYVFLLPTTSHFSQTYGYLWT